MVAHRDGTNSHELAVTPLPVTLLPGPADSVSPPAYTGLGMLPAPLFALPGYRFCTRSHSG